MSGTGRARRAPAAALALLLATPAAAQPAQTVSAAPEKVVITLYREGDLTSRQLQESPDAAGRGLVMVTETRTVDIPAGGGRIAFRGVADGMIPETAVIRGLPAGVAEQNYDYDLLTPGALAARSVGETVRLVRTNPATGKVTEERALVRSAPEGVVLDVNGRIEALDCSGLPERLVFDRVPEGLADRPTLSVATRAAAAERRTVTLSYLATGLAWSADYVIRLSPDGRTADVTGWLTLANSTDTTFGQAPTEVVAGNLSREDVRRIEPQRMFREQRCWPSPVRWNTGYAKGRLSGAIPPPPPPPPPPAMAPAPVEMAEAITVTGSRIARQSELGDYKLYTLPEATTLAAHQVKQVRFLEANAVRLERVYVADLQTIPNAELDRAAAIELRFENTKAQGLGAPLPAGALVVMEPGPGGRLLLAGQDGVDDTPIGLPFEAEIGRAQDVRLRETLLDTTRSERGGREQVRRRYAVELANAKPVPVRLELKGPPTAGVRIVDADRRAEAKEGRSTWTFDLKPGERRTFRYGTESEG
jgi:hypothetical protein